MREDEMLTALSRMHAEGDGIWQMQFWSVSEFMTIALVSEEDRVQTMLEWLGDLAEASMKSNRDERPKCFTCDYVFSKRYGPKTMVAFSAYTNDPDTFIMAGLCRKCASKGHKVVSDSCMQALGEHLPVRLRALDVHSDVGHG